MGTRGSLKLISRGRKVVCTHIHWDAYPLGVGLSLINELIAMLEASALEGIISRVYALHVVDIESQPSEAQILALVPFTDLRVSDQTTSDWYCLLRKCQGSVRRMLDAGIALDDGRDAEFNYVIDFDTRTISCAEAKWGSVPLDIDALQAMRTRVTAADDDEDDDEDDDDEDDDDDDDDDA